VTRRAEILTFLDRPYAKHHPQFDADLNHRETDARMKALEGMARAVLARSYDHSGDDCIHAEGLLEAMADCIPKAQP
jgi:hypothetical protein